MNDVICALATPSGRSAIAIIRVTGGNSLKIAEEIFESPITSKTTLHENARCSLFGKIYYNGTVIDEVILVPFIAPYSYTGENSFEIQCHGNPLIVKKIFELLLKKGVRVAQPGEFTKRAFENNKLDLSAAEAVKKIIDARSEYELQKAHNLRDGSFKKEISTLRSHLLNITAELEAELDFIDENLDFKTNKEKINKVDSLLHKITILIERSKSVDQFRDGIKVAIIGRPNAGKSSLLNFITGINKSIVSTIAGTTRDLIESKMSISGVAITFIDTAGLRFEENDINEIEKEGIRRSLFEASQADLILHVIDSSLGDNKTPEDIKKLIDHKTHINIYNKSDIASPSKQKLDKDSLSLSLKENLNTDILMKKIEDYVRLQMPHSDGLLLSIWQIELLIELRSELLLAKQSFISDEQPEIIASQMRSCLTITSQLTGEITNEDLLGRIFSRFCVGK